ncbi:MAG TPA: hypothetical protein VGG28_10865 [Kofleriaceae bacterium]|jgi:hypothetical protein
MRLLLSLAALALMTTPARADPSLALSITGGALPLAAMGAGVALRNPGLLVAGAVAGLVTPAAGELYAHHWLTRGMAMRGGAAVIAVADLLVFRLEALSSPHEVSPGITPGVAGAAGVAAALYLAGIGFDIGDARTVAIAPTVIETPAHRVTGVAVVATF